MSLDIRIAKPADAERLADLARRTFLAAFENFNTPENMSIYMDESFSDEQILAELEDHSSTFIWAEETGIPAGYAKLRRGTISECVTGPAPVELERIYAETNQIGAGVGKTLLHTALKIALAHHRARGDERRHTETVVQQAARHQSHDRGQAPRSTGEALDGSLELRTGGLGENGLERGPHRPVAEREQRGGGEDDRVVRRHQQGEVEAPGRPPRSASARGRSATIATAAAPGRRPSAG